MAIPSGDISFLRNVPLTASYEHTIDFKTKDEQYRYFRSFLKRSFGDYSYIRKEREFIAVELPLSYLDDINYLYFRSSEDDRLYYAFVTDKVYVNPTTSYVYFMIDVMQTYMFDYEWRASYIQQAHVDRWTAEHKPIYSKTDEGLNYGTEYAIESAYRLKQSDNLVWLLVTMKNYSELVASGLVANSSRLLPVSTPYVCFLVPIAKNKTNGGNNSIVNVSVTNSTFLTGNVNGEVIGGIATYQVLCDYMLNTAIGNYIVSINVLTYNPFVESEVDDGSKIVVTLKNDGISYAYTKFTATNGDIKFLMLYEITSDFMQIGRNLAHADWNIGLEDSLPTEKQWEEIKANPRTTKRDKRFESKLLCSPYRYNLLTDWRNESVILKNEYMTNNKIEVKYSFALGSNSPFRFWVDGYKKDPYGRTSCLMQPMSLDMPIISDAYYTYMLENKNTIEANLTNAKISAATSVAGGIASGIASGGIFGALAGGVSSGVNAAVNVSAMIRSENAKQTDLKAKPDIIMNSNDSAFNVIDETTEVNFYRMRICCENEEILGEIFNMSGYKVHRVEIPNTRSRVRFNYIQTLGANIVGSFNQSDLLKIKEIYDKGITIWHYSEKDFNPLDYSYENIEVNLI